MKVGAVVEVSDDDDGDFEPPSQANMSRKRKAAGVKQLKKLGSTKGGVHMPGKRSRFFCSPDECQVIASQDPICQRVPVLSMYGSTSQKTVPDMFKSQRDKKRRPHGSGAVMQVEPSSSVENDCSSHAQVLMEKEFGRDADLGVRPVREFSFLSSKRSCTNATRERVVYASKDVETHSEAATGQCSNRGTESKPGKRPGCGDVQTSMRSQQRIRDMLRTQPDCSEMLQSSQTNYAHHVLQRPSNNDEGLLTRREAAGLALEEGFVSEDVSFTSDRRINGCTSGNFEGSSLARHSGCLSSLERDGAWIGRNDDTTIGQDEVALVDCSLPFRSELAQTHNSGNAAENSTTRSILSLSYSNGGQQGAMKFLQPKSLKTNVSSYNNNSNLQDWQSLKRERLQRVNYGHHDGELLRKERAGRVDTSLLATENLKRESYDTNGAGSDGEPSTKKDSNQESNADFMRGVTVLRKIGQGVEFDRNGEGCLIAETGVTCRNKGTPKREDSEFISAGEVLKREKLKGVSFGGESLKREKKESERTFSVGNERLERVFGNQCCSGCKEEEILEKETIGKRTAGSKSGQNASLDLDRWPTWSEEFSHFTRSKHDKRSNTGPNAKAALEALKSAASRGQILHIECMPARQAKYAECDYKLPAKLQKVLGKRGINQLYAHQAEALNMVFQWFQYSSSDPHSLWEKHDLHNPGNVLDALMKVPKSRAIFIFPLKALARDQLKAISEMISQVKSGAHCYCYDGDTDQDKKKQIRRTGKVIFTNPDMLHFSILPYHKLWENFFANLKFVVLDEAHTYRGVFGSHVGCILRRLLRIARHYGSEPMFICCSATIGNPKDHVKRLTTVDVEVIHGSGAPTGEKYVVCWQPPLKDGKRRSAYRESVKIVVALVKAGLHILVFVEARKLAEIICNLVRGKLAKINRHDLVERVNSYRAGYTPEERLALEKRLQCGEIRALITTRALELGIDVGELDATVHVGLPNTMCSLWQQAGRAGRRQGASLAVIVGQERPMDMYYMNNPQKLFERDVEQAFCNPCNSQLLRLQLPCAAQELPLCDEDKEYFGENFEESRDNLATEAILKYKLGPKGQSLYEYRYENNPAGDFSIRGTSANYFQLLTEKKQLVEEVDGKMALRMLFEGAIYPHLRDTYRIVKLDIKKKQAMGTLCDVHHTTVVKEKTTVVILEEICARTVKATRVHLGKFENLMDGLQLQVKEQVVGYSEHDLLKNKISQNFPLDLPPSEFGTIGLWWDIPGEALQRLHNKAYDVLLVLRRVVLALLPSMIMSDPTDMIGLETLTHEQTQLPQIFVYDAYPGGIGLAEQTYNEIEAAWQRALCVMCACDCPFGCPACTQSVHDNDEEDRASSIKHESIKLLEALLGIHQTTVDPSPSGTLGKV